MPDSRTTDAIRSRLDGRVYDRLFDRCSTENQLAAVQIRLENRMTPMEATAIADHVISRYVEVGLRRRITWLRIERDRRFGPEPEVGAPRPAPRYLRAVQAGQWAQGVQRQLRLSARPPVAVERAWVRGGATLYRSGAVGPRTLVIGFSGNLRGFMMPTQVFLQFVGDRPVDVLKLEVPRGIGYIEGVPAFSHDFASTLTWLAEVITAGAYARVVSFGTSGGGLPALLAASRLGTDAALAVGPAAQMNAVEMAAQLGAASVTDILAATPHHTAVTMVYGEQSTRDAESVDHLAAAVPVARVLRVADAGHACLFDLAERHELDELVADVVFGERAASPATSRAASP